MNIIIRGDNAAELVIGGVRVLYSFSDPVGLRDKSGAIYGIEHPARGVSMKHMSSWMWGMKALDYALLPNREFTLTVLREIRDAINSELKKT